jgi:16S rRNA (guanine527-N7)-methyltransferase
MEATLRQGAQALNLGLSAGQIEQLLAYLAQLQRWNQVYNLTSVRDPQEMLTHHLLDSLAVVAPLQMALQRRIVVGVGVQAALAQPTGVSDPSLDAQALARPAARPSTAASADAAGRVASVLDVGSGGGLPGVVLAIACPDITVTCIDTVAKKAAFIQQIAGVLGLANLRAVHSRVESWSGGPFDVITSRAFASLKDFVSLTRFHVKHPHAGGVGWMAMKARQPELELQDLPEFAQWDRTEQLTVPGLGEERCLVWMRPRD